MPLGVTYGILSFAYGNINDEFGELVRIARSLCLEDCHGSYSLTIRSTLWFTPSRAFLLAASRRVSFSLFSNRSDWCCDLSSLVLFFAMPQVYAVHAGVQGLRFSN